MNSSVSSTYKVINDKRVNKENTLLLNRFLAYAYIGFSNTEKVLCRRLLCFLLLDSFVFLGFTEWSVEFLLLLLLLLLLFNVRLLFFTDSQNKSAIMRIYNDPVLFCSFVM